MIRTEKQKQASLENNVIRQMRGVEMTLTKLGGRYRPYLMMARNYRRNFEDKCRLMAKERKDQK